MPFTQMFAFIYSKQVVAIIQAPSKRAARSRARLVDHLEKIHQNCKVRAIRDGNILRAPVFFDGHFRALEDSKLEDDVLSHHRMTPYQRA